MLLLQMLGVVLDIQALHLYCMQCLITMADSHMLKAQLIEGKCRHSQLVGHVRTWMWIVVADTEMELGPSTLQHLLQI